MENKRSENIKKLVELITEGYEVEHLNDIVSNLGHAIHHPYDYAEKNDLLWLYEENESNPLSLDYIIPLEINEIAIVGDKIDEIHDQIGDIIEDLPEFPFDEKMTAKEYFIWLDDILSESNEEILEIGKSFGDDLILFLVYKKNTDEIIKICQQFDLKCSNPKNTLY